jgi:hypothetical protein
MLRPKGARESRHRFPPGASHYDVLGVGPSANSLQIRAAYVRLLKNSHPDSAPVGAKGRSTEVDRLVTAYKILRDDRLRAAYDTQLYGGFREEARWRSAPPVRKRRRPHHNRVRAATALSLLVLVSAALALPMLNNDSRNSNLDRYPRTQLAAVGRDDVPTPASLEPMARLAARLPAEDATAFSKSCFAKARTSDSPSAADPCIAFDTAFIYWQQGVAGTYLGEPYFQPQAEAARTENALERLDPDAAMVRAASIRASTFAALLRLVNDKADPVGSEEDVAGQGELATGPAVDLEDGAENADPGPSRIDTSAH